MEMEMIMSQEAPEKKKLSPTMRVCVSYALEHGGKLVRYPGGFWCRPGLERWEVPSFGTTTVEALVKRGVAEYTEWFKGEHSNFPIEVTIIRAALSAAQE